MNSPSHTIAVVGRPNVGKSTLFNRLVGGRPALVHDTPGLTRDRRYGDVDYFGRVFRLVDTGGLDPEAEGDIIGAGIHRQAWKAVSEADAIMLVVDANAGISPLDEGIAKKLRATGRPVFLVANKVDHPNHEAMVPEFFRMGLGQPFAVSAAHGRGFDDLLDELCRKLDVPVQTAVTVAEDDSAEVASEADDESPGAKTWRQVRHDPNRPLRVAFVGRPNAGKSSLTNRLLGEERSLVHDQAGTTTDPVDSPFELGGKQYVLVDTAGIRRKAKVDEDIERIAVSMAIGQIERADVVVLVIDASIGASEQDARLAGMVAEAGRALVVALNKIDLVTGETARAKLAETTTDTFHFLNWSHVVNLSAMRGDGINRLMDAVNQAATQYARRIPTAELNRFFIDVCETTPPPVHRGRTVRVYYLTQGATRPPTFLLWTNSAQGVSPAYKRFVMNRLRERYGFRGTPLRVIIRAKDEAKTEQEALQATGKPGRKTPPKRRKRA